MVLTTNSSVPVEIPDELNIDQLDYNQIKEVFKREGSGKIERHCDWELENQEVISIFGWKKGKAGNENKNDLPPPEDVDIFYGDVLVVKSKSGVLVDLSLSTYNKFYEMACGDFEDLDSDESLESIGEYDLDDSFIASSDDDDFVEEDGEEDSAEFTGSDTDVSLDDNNDEEIISNILEES